VDIQKELREAITWIRAALNPPFLPTSVPASSAASSSSSSSCSHSSVASVVPIDDEVKKNKIPRMLSVLTDANDSNIQRNAPRVLVHCVAGSSRSPTVVAAYLCATKHFPDAVHAFAHVKRQASWIMPSGFFQKQVELLCAHRAG